VDEVVDLMIVRTGGEKKDKTDKLISMILLTCYKKISESQAKILSEKQSEDIDPMTQENKDLIELESWKELYQNNDTDKLAKGLDDISKTMKELKEEEPEVITETIDDEMFVNGETGTKEAKNYGLFGFNFKSMDSSLVNIIGFSLLSIIALLAIYALKTLKKTEKKKKEKKGKKE
jgi:hypothetical protein